MATNFKELMTSKSDDGLIEYVNNMNRYTSESIKAAVDELKRRGRNFTDEELNDIYKKIQENTESEKDEDNFWAPNTKDRNIVTDENAPLLYSKGTIRGFSVFFTVIFGAVLLASNINDPKRKWTVIGFGILYTAISIIILNQIPRSTFWTLLLNTAGGLGLTTTFWDKYVGKETRYRTKPIWKPLIISIVITIPFILALIYG